MKKINQVFDHKWWFYDLVKWTSVPFSNLFFRHKKIYATGKKQKEYLKGRLIVCSNHVSLEDAAGIATCFWSRRISFMIANDMIKAHKAKHFFRNVGCIGVDRDNFEIDSIKKAINVINRGHVVGIFPEGKISHSDDLLPFKSGMVMTAFLSNSDILPVYISKRKTKKENWVMVVGERIHIKDMFKNQCPTIDEINSITDYINNKEQELKQIYIDRWLNRRVK